MFFKLKPTVDQSAINWQLATWTWLIENLGHRFDLVNRKTLIPSASDFPPSTNVQTEHASYVFRQVAKYMGVDTKDFQLEIQEDGFDPVLGNLAIAQNVSANPHGTYRKSNDEKHVITYSPLLLENLEGLIATFCHEICHPVLLSIPQEPPGGSEMEEFATDLAMAFFGFGIFGANTAFSFNQYTDIGGGAQGWSFEKSGYLLPGEWAFALAVRSILVDEDYNPYASYMKPATLADFKRNRKFLKKSGMFEALRCQLNPQHSPRKPVQNSHR